MKRAIWDGDDRAAIQYLSGRGLTYNKSYYWQIPKGRRMTPKENAALNYLFCEWDWASEIVEVQK